MLPIGITLKYEIGKIGPHFVVCVLSSNSEGEKARTEVVYQSTKRQKAVGVYEFLTRQPPSIADEFLRNRSGSSDNQGNLFGKEVQEL